MRRKNIVSVCMATYNGERFIKEQIQSILSQIGIADELVISDDSSTDSTVEIIKAVGDKRIRLFSGNSFRDPIKNFQHCLRQAAGEIIFLSDQDDVWLEGKYTRMKELLEEYDLVVSDSIVTDETLQVVKPSFFRFFNSGKGLMKNIWKSSYYGSCMAFRADLLQRALPFPDTTQIGHDLWIGLVAELTGRVLFYDQPFLLYRRHAGAFVPGAFKSRRSFAQKLSGRMIMIKEITRFLISYKWKKD